jgi:hypothetical protein
MKYQPQKTLAYYNTAPHLHVINLSQVPMAGLAKSIKKYKSSCGQVHPETEAIWFYTMNHLVSLVKSRFTLHEELPEWAIKVMEEYMTTLSQCGQRMMAYIACITVRESRHLNSQGDKWWDDLDKKFGTPFRKFISEVESGGSEITLLNTPPKCNFLQFSEGMMYVFDEGKHWGGGYGGEAWGNVARALYRFAKGEFSMEMMLDTAFTLAHNGGPIFNKGMMYHGWGGEFIKILDVQRSGQMPQLMMDNTMPAFYMQSVFDLVNLVFQHAPEAFSVPYVDWYTVKPTEGMDYSHLKTKQKKLHGTSPSEKVKQVLQKKPEIGPEVVPLAEKSYVPFFTGVATKVGTYSIGPNQEVSVVVRGKK